jgi:hypothetical protein
VKRLVCCSGDIGRDDRQGLRLAAVENSLRFKCAESVGSGRRCCTIDALDDDPAPTPAP